MVELSSRCCRILSPDGLPIHHSSGFSVDGFHRDYLCGRSVQQVPAVWEPLSCNPIVGKLLGKKVYSLRFAPWAMKVRPYPLLQPITNDGGLWLGFIGGLASSR